MLARLPPYSWASFGKRRLRRYRADYSARDNRCYAHIWAESDFDPTEPDIDVFSWSWLVDVDENRALGEYRQSRNFRNREPPRVLVRLAVTSRQIVSRRTGRGWP